MRIARLAVTLLIAATALSGCYGDRPGFWGDHHGHHGRNGHGDDHHHHRH